MKKQFRFFGMVFLVLSMLGLAAATTGKDKKDKKSAAKHLKQTKKALLKSVSGLNETQLNFKPAADKWSIKECMQHLALAEVGLWQWYDGVMKAPANPEKRADIKVTDADMLKNVSNRSNKAQAPENFQPSKAPWSNMPDVINAFTTERDKRISYVKTTEDDMRSHINSETPFGAIDAYQLVLLITAHTNRHTQQIEEVKNNPNFPK